MPARKARKAYHGWAANRAYKKGNTDKGHKHAKKWWSL